MKHRRHASGFSLVELVIVVVIVGLLAAIAIPRFSQGASGASNSALAGDLAVLRNAIELYAAEHNGKYPAQADFADLLTKYSNLAGNDTSNTKGGVYVYGPYLHAVPALKLGDNAGKSGVGASTAGTLAETSNDSNGWLYDEATGQIWANESDFFGR
ncbi:MAG: prepilin-type N-terminal cleavage/methylation domain-containing protein [Planctomycetota bacterium]